MKLEPLNKNNKTPTTLTMFFFCVSQRKYETSTLSICTFTKEEPENVYCINKAGVV